jgi:cysteinyl-tRNA synthetase
VLKSYDGETIRFFMVRVHYRRPFNFSDAGLDDAKLGLKRLYTALDVVPPADVKLDWASENEFVRRFKQAMDNDLSTPEAIAVLFDLAAEINRSRSAELAGWLKVLGAILGILQGDPKAYLQQGATLDAAAIEAKITERAAAKAAKNFALSDQIRQDLAAQGIVLKDSAAGTTWEAQS